MLKLFSTMYLARSKKSEKFLSPLWRKTKRVPSANLYNEAISNPHWVLLLYKFSSVPVVALSEHGSVLSVNCRAEEGGLWAVSGRGSVRSSAVQWIVYLDHRPSKFKCWCARHFDFYFGQTWLVIQGQESNQCKWLLSQGKKCWRDRKWIYGKIQS